MLDNIKVFGVGDFNWLEFRINQWNLYNQEQSNSIFNTENTNSLDLFSSTQDSFNKVDYLFNSIGENKEIQTYNFFFKTKTINNIDNNLIDFLI